MKVAMIASGLPRFAPDFIDLMNKLKGFESADIYMCLWKTDWASTAEEARAKIEKILLPQYRLAKIIVVDEPPYELPPHTFPLAPPQPENTTWWYKRIFAQFTGLTMAFDLIDQDYDVVIKFRVDGSLEQELDVSILDLKNNPLIFPGSTGAGFDYCKISDLFFAGTQEGMKFNCSLSKEFKELVVAADPTWGDSDIVDGTWTWGTEHLMGFYMKKYNFPVTYGNFRTTLNSYGRTKYTDRHYHHQVVKDPTEKSIMKILLLGDSHTDPFIHMPNVTRCDLSKCTPWLFTTHRFTDPTDLDLWSTIDDWIIEHTVNTPDPAKVLIVTGGEIDIRAHFWRHIPRHYKTAEDIEKYVQEHALKFYNTLTAVCEKYNLDHVVVWGSPVAGEKAQYNNEHPFTGSSQTRNKLIHLWNVAFAELIIDADRFSLASAFYEFINPDYTTVDPTPSHDGVHWHDSYGPIFWENIILPAIENKGLYLDEKWNSMYNDTFEMTETLSQGKQLYDSWVRSDQLENTEGLDRFVYINGNTYAWVSADQRSLLPEQYIELSLKKI